jgi:hypothetical protein
VHPFSETPGRHELVKKLAGSKQKARLRSWNRLRFTPRPIQLWVMFICTKWITKITKYGSWIGRTFTFGLQPISLGRGTIQWNDILFCPS